MAWQNAMNAPWIHYWIIWRIVKPRRRQGSLRCPQRRSCFASDEFWKGTRKVALCFRFTNLMYKGCASEARTHRLQLPPEWPQQFHTFGTLGVAGSNPVTPTITKWSIPGTWSTPLITPISTFPPHTATARSSVQAAVRRVDRRSS